MVKARPNLNGNRPEDFQNIARKLHDLVSQLDFEMGAVKGELFHGRNYQTYSTTEIAEAARKADLATFAIHKQRVKELEAWLTEIYMAGYNDY